MNEKYTLSRLKDSLRLLQEHRATYFDLIFLGTSLRHKKLGKPSLGAVEVRQLSKDDRDLVTHNILMEVSKWCKEYLHILSPLLERLKFGLNFEAETPRGQRAVEHHQELLKVSNQMKGFLREMKARIYLIQQDVHEFYDAPNGDYDRILFFFSLFPCYSSFFSFISLSFNL